MHPLKTSASASGPPHSEEVRCPVDRTLRVFSVPVRALVLFEKRSFSLDERRLVTALHATESRGSR